MGASKPLSPAERRPAPRTAWKKGCPGGPGRPKGIPNKVTLSVREAIVAAFEKMGGVDALVKWAKKNPTDFYKLWTRLLPVQITGEGGGPIRIETKHDLSRLSIDELSELTEYIDRTRLAQAAGGETFRDGTVVNRIKPLQRS